MPFSPFVIERTSRLPVSAQAAYDWHARPGAFARLTPPWEKVTVLDRSGDLADARAVLRVFAGPVPLRWVARHRDAVAGRQFVDEQVAGPFTRWVHLHRFDPEGPAQCMMTDRVEFVPPWGGLGAAAAPVIRSRVERLLDYRHALLPADLETHAKFAGRPALHIAVTGSTGLLGRSLVPFLTSGGHRITRVVRGKPDVHQVGWDPAAGRIDVAGLEGVDAVVHLAGENVGARWSAARMREIRGSRVRGTRLLCEALGRLRDPPRVLVSASAIGIYGNRGDDLLVESSPPSPQRDFLTDVGREWEAATEAAQAAGIRVVTLRFGIILTPGGGALGRMLTPFRLGVGGPLGSGSQWMSWISIDDAVGAVHHALMTDDLEGPVNATSPGPVVNREFTATLGRVLRRPARIAVPALALRLALGDLADVGLLSSARVIPEQLVASGYRFRHPGLEEALRFVLGRERH